jgi:hypothetical protein
VRENEPYNEWWAPLEANGPYGNFYVIREREKKKMDDDDDDDDDECFCFLSFSFSLMF